MAFEQAPLRGVSNFYGPRSTVEGLGGEFHTEGALVQAALEFSGKNINDAASTLTTVIPQNAKVLRVFVDVEEAVTDLAGTTPTILVGTQGSEVTNGVVISEAQAEAKAVYDITSTRTGTWGASFAADTTVAVTLGGTTPTITDDGRLKVVIEYIHVTRS